MGVISVLGLSQYKLQAENRQRMENQYNRAFYEMVSSVQSVEVMLSKAMISGSPKQSVNSLSQVWQQANLAQADLGQLPVSNVSLDNTSKFLSQVSDYSFSLLNQSLTGKKLSTKQFNELKMLHDYATKMTNNLSGTVAALGQGRLKWGELTKRGSARAEKTSANFTTSQFQGLEKSFNKYPSLIYDGPFSDNLEKVKPKGLVGNDVTQEQARVNAVNFIGQDRVQEIKFTGMTDGNLKIYNFQVKIKNSPKDGSCIVSVTKKGGHVILVTCNRTIGKEVLNMKQAEAFGKQFLNSKGFKSMTQTYYLKEDGVATINYAYSQNNVIVYPDLIKLKIALDSGEVMGFEGRGYFDSHRVRKIGTPKVTAAQAKKNINPNLKIVSQGLAIIPTKWKTETFVYEFKGKVDNRDFIVYVNANTGKEEQILVIVNTPNGILTM
jgi:germination protein YpeB